MKSQHGNRTRGLGGEENLNETITHADLVLPTTHEESSPKTISFQDAAMRIMGKLSGAFYERKLESPFLCMWGHDRNSFKDSVYPILKPQCSQTRLRFLEIDLRQQQLRDAHCLGRVGLAIHVDDLDGWQYVQSTNSEEVSQTCKIYGKSIARALLSGDTCLQDGHSALREERLKDIQTRLLKNVEGSFFRIFSYLLHSKVRDALHQLRDSIRSRRRISDARIFIVFEVLQLELSDDSCPEQRLVLHCFPSLNDEAPRGPRNSACFALGQAPYCQGNSEAATSSANMQPRRRSTDSISELSDGDPSKSCGTPFSYYDVEEENLREDYGEQETQFESGHPETPHRPNEAHIRPKSQLDPELLLLSKHSLLRVSSVVRMGVTLALSVLSGVVILLLMSVPEKVLPGTASEEWRRMASAFSLGLVGLVNFVLVIWFIKVIVVKSRRSDGSLSFRFFCLVVITGYVAWMDYSASRGITEFLLPPHSILNPARLQSWSAYLTLIIFTVYCCVAWLLGKSWKSAMVLEQLGERGQISSLTRYSTSVFLVVMTVASVLYMCFQDIRVSRLASIFFMPLVSLFACLCILSTILGSYAKQLSRAIAEVNHLNKSSSEERG
eukprot:gb/GECG01008557.1/.p1 GENE.gb/GECG01008557.1/~~gb/GECG01008557.1/.p1  ORF type:complete len:611 (+),score=54.94 gb/GECG01008557.1/:1-1833(+)